MSNGVGCTSVMVARLPVWKKVTGRLPLFRPQNPLGRLQCSLAGFQGPSSKGKKEMGEDMGKGRGGVEGKGWDGYKIFYCAILCYNMPGGALDSIHSV